MIKNTYLGRFFNFVFGKSKNIEAIKIINAFNAADSYYKFEQLVGDLLRNNTKTVYQKLEEDFNRDMWEFLSRSATTRQSEILKVNGDIWSHRNMFNTLNGLKEQKPLDDSFKWVKSYL